MSTLLDELKSTDQRAERNNLYAHKLERRIDNLTAENTRLAERVRALEKRVGHCEGALRCINTAIHFPNVEPKMDIPQFIKETLIKSDALAAAIAEQGDAVVPRG